MWDDIRWWKQEQPLEILCGIKRTIVAPIRHGPITQPSILFNRGFTSLKKSLIKKKKPLKVQKAVCFLLHLQPPAETDANAL